MKTILCLMVLLCFAGVASATDYYVDKDSIGGTASDSNNGTQTYSPWLTVAKASTELSGGDTVYIRAGVYSEIIYPSNSGNSGNYITYQRYPSDAEWSVVIRGGVVAACSYRSCVCMDKDYIKIDGMYFNLVQYGRWVETISGSDHVIFDNCKYYNSEIYSGFRINSGTEYVTIKNSSFPDAPIQGDGCWQAFCQSGPPYSNSGCGNTIAESNCDTCCWSETSPADMIRDYGTYTVIDSCNFGNCSHGSISSDGSYGVVRNCTFDNAYHSAWASGGNKYLSENNIVKNSGIHHTYNPSYRDRAKVNGGGLYNYNQYGITRFNVVYQSDYGYFFGGSTHKAEHQKTYHNTLYNNSIQIGTTANNANKYFDNELKNNVFYNETPWAGSLTGNSCFATAGQSAVANCCDNPVADIENYYRNNVFRTGSIFFFKDTSTTSRTLAQVKSSYPLEWFSSNFETSSPGFNDTGNFDFELQTGSPLINAADWLTTVNCSTNTGQTLITVEDAGYFYDGWGIPGEVGDTIMTEGGEETVIQSINYNTHVLTVSPAIDIVEDEGVSLPYNGASPDVGAFEFDADNAAPNITSWSNNDTNTNVLVITIDGNQNVKYNATANQTITTWSWNKDGIPQSHNYDNITISFDSSGEKTVSVSATNSNGTSSTIQWDVTINNIGSWDYHKNVVIDHSYVNGTQSNFPVLVSITDADLRDHAQTGGDDIIFKSGSTQLSHSIESWENSTGELVAWVNIPTLSGYIDTTIVMYYGNSEALNSENVSGVWDSNYKMVQHMNEDPSGSSPQMIDSTSNSYDAVTFGSMTSGDQVDGVADGALDYDGSNDYLNMSAPIAQHGDKWTLSSWVNLTTWTSNDLYHIFAIDGTKGQSVLYIQGSTASCDICSYVDDSKHVADDALDQNETYYIVLTKNTSSFKWFINGNYSGGFDGTASIADETFIIGSCANGQGDYFEGVIDEVRVSDIDRSHAWVETCYNTTNNPSYFMTFGDEQGQEQSYTLKPGQGFIVYVNVTGEWTP